MLNWLRRKKRVPNGFQVEWRLTSPHQKKVVPPGKDQCSFCSKNRSAVRRLVPGPNNIGICDDCLDMCAEILRQNEGYPLETPKQKPPLECSFCLKSQDEVKYLIAGPAVYICGDCAVRLRQSAQ